MFPPIDEETLYARAPRVSARADGTNLPGRDGELARRVSHDLAAWCAKPRHRATREPRGVHAIEFKCARRRTKLEVHGDARTRPVSARLQKRKETPSRTVPGPLFEPVQGSKRCARARRTTTERLGANRFREVHALCEALRASLGSRCVQGMGNRHVSGIQDLTSLSNGVQCRLSTLEVGARAC